MKYRNLGRTGVKVSPICLGNLMFGEKPHEQAEEARILEHGVDAGINFLDTANSYGRGGCERRIGEVLKRIGGRDRIVLASKVHGAMADDDPNARGNSRRHIIEQCDASLKRLQTDWIDLYQLHRPQSDIPIDETLRALDDLVRAGKVRYLGTSSFPAWHIVESFWASKELGLNRFVCEQPLYHVLDRRIEREIVPMALTYGVAIIPFSPLAGGFLTGKYRRDRPWPEDGRFARIARMAGSQSHRTAFADAEYAAVETLDEIAKEKGCTTSQLALAWNVQQPAITSPIIGPRTVEQLDDNLGALDVEVSDEDRARIDQVAPPGRRLVQQPDPGFGPHRFRW